MSYRKRTVYGFRVGVQRKKNRQPLGAERRKKKRGSILASGETTLPAALGSREAETAGRRIGRKTLHYLKEGNKGG